MAAVPSQPTGQLPSSDAMQVEIDEEERIYNGYRSFVQTLPRIDRCIKRPLYLHPDQWYCITQFMVGALAVIEHFKARPSDILFVSHPKSGSTWLKALLFLTVNRSLNPFLLRNDTTEDGNHPFVTANPHKLVPFLEIKLYSDQIPNLEIVPPPRLYASHIPYQSLPKSIKASGCRIVYLCRNPLDTFVSWYHFLKKVSVLAPESFTLSEYLEEFSSGHTAYGPFWDHMLGYWNASKAMPQNVLFLKYEEMRKEPAIHLKKLAEFVGYPFTEEEEADGVVEKILRLSSFDNLSTMEANKRGMTRFGHVMLENASFFRKGEVGDWKNYLTTEMADRLCAITNEKFQGTGLDFQIS